MIDRVLRDFTQEGRLAKIFIFLKTVSDKFFIKSFRFLPLHHAIAVEHYQLIDFMAIMKVVNGIVLCY